MYDPALMQMFQGGNDTSGIKGSRRAPRLIFHQDLRIVSDNLHKASSKSSFQQKIDVLFIFEGPMKMHDEWAIQHGEELTLPAH
mmetsp:Transcript_103521/g.183915  ORF Transcript_103521/g.183915 Transcript_103521/m.183915 type:complete len:84 (+) Transcript_103521:917-1168(+)